MLGVGTGTIGGSGRSERRRRCRRAGCGRGGFRHRRRRDDRVLLGAVGDTNAITRPTTSSTATAATTHSQRGDLGGGGPSGGSPAVRRTVLAGPVLAGGVRVVAVGRVRRQLPGGIGHLRCLVGGSVRGLARIRRIADSRVPGSWGPTVGSARDRRLAVCWSYPPHGCRVPASRQADRRRAGKHVA